MRRRCWLVALTQWLLLQEQEASVNQLEELGEVVELHMLAAS